MVNTQNKLRECIINLLTLNVGINDINDLKCSWLGKDAQGFLAGVIVTSDSPNY